MAKAPKSPPGPLSLEVAKILRAEMGLQDSMSKSELARRAGIERTMVSDIVRGKQQADIEQLDIICQALGLSLTDVLRRAESATDVRRLG